MVREASDRGIDGWVKVEMRRDYTSGRGIKVMSKSCWEALK